MILNKTPAVLKKMYPSLIWEKKSSSKIYLTFDDGPHPGITHWVLDQLDYHKAKATFFCIGKNLEDFERISKETIEQGHRIANHTYVHEEGWKTNDQNYLESVEKCNELIEEIQGHKNELFRPPYGRIKKSQITQIKSKYQIIMWSHLAGDFTKNLAVSATINKLKKAKPGSIVVFHDNEKSFENLKKILPEVLAHWSSLNYQFSTL